MQPVDSEVLNQVRQWLEDGERSWLATVVQTWGSSPRPAGSLLACNDSGSIRGSLSGGCVEDDLLDKLRAGELAHDGPQFFEYGVTTEETERLGLPCGGNLQVVVEPLHIAEQSKAHFAQIAQHLADRKCITRTVELSSGAFSAQAAERFKPLHWDEASKTLSHTYGPRYQLFIIGAGMVSGYLAEMAQNLNFEVTVCDPREHLLADFNVSGVNLVCEMPDDAIRKRANDAQSAIVALTHDPRIDDMGLMQALETEAFYIGAMGSKKTSIARRERLKMLDLSDTMIDRLHAPIGLPIGSKTPPEIAVAIIAEIIAVQKKAATRARDALNARSKAAAA